MMSMDAFGPLIGTRVGALLLIPVLYAILKIAAGALILHYGKQYADRVKEDEQ